ncbi:MAG TPA: UDP-N-acetylmuramate dehydrogenase [Bryobacteraceae bacterium]|nr:UDP-N-acetylmuramate dehydrogenase [Bryobacteraceae bacterium]
MHFLSAARSRLVTREGLRVEKDAPLSLYTRFGLGGSASYLVDASSEDSLREAVQHITAEELPFVVIGGGSNLVVADAGYQGVVLRYTAKEVSLSGACVTADAGANLQKLVDFTIDHGLAGIHTMTGIPGWVGGAIYGNAGAYGRSTHESIESVRFFDGAEFGEFSNQQCGFRYRHSRFKDDKSHIILSSRWALTPGDAEALRKQAAEILAVRNAKYPPEMKCAGSIFKNLLFAELPPSAQKEVDPKVVREGKVPSAYFLERVAAKGMRNGDIHVADYHANLIYNVGNGTARQVREIVDELKARVRDRFCFEVEEEVQYVGF